MDNYLIARKILLEEDDYTPVSKLKWSYISNIITDPLSPELNTSLYRNSPDKTILATLIDTPKVPMQVKKEAIDTMVTIDSSISTNFIAPLLFYGNKENLKNLSPHMAFKIVSNLDWVDFHSQLNTYLLENPDITNLPFSNSNIEKILLQRLLKDTTNGEKIPPKVYRFIEHISNHHLLHDILEKQINLPSVIISSLINNKYIADKEKESLFNLDIDISKIKYCSSDKAKELYESAIYPICHPDDFISDDTQDYLQFSSDSILNLIKNNLLPETCEIDLIKRFINKEIHKSQNFISTLLFTTKNPDVLNEVFNIKNSSLVTSVVKNPNTPLELREKIIEKFLIDTTNKETGGTWSDWDYLDTLFSTECLKMPLKKTHYLLLLRQISSPAAIQTALESMALNACLPKSIFSDVMFTSDSTTSTIKTFCYFNKCVRDNLSPSDAQAFLNTIDVIYNYLKYNDDISDRYENFLFPISNPSLLHTLNNILNDIIKEEPTDEVKRCVQCYKDIIIKKQLEKEGKRIIDTFNIENTSVKELNEAKHQMYNRITSPYGTPITKIEMIDTTFDTYLFYKNLVTYTDLYQKINNRVQELMPDTNLTPTKTGEEPMF